MVVELPIAVVLVDDHEHELARKALVDTLLQITPHQLLIFTDQPERIRVGGAQYHHFRGGSVVAAAHAVWYDVPPLLKVDHFLSIQADGWVLNASRWTDEFLECDYIGAPWPVEPGNIWWRLGYTKGRNVGNGGFSLVSTKLARHVSDNRDRYPLIMPGDDSLCRRYRSALEAEGFRWASEELAAQFSFECALPPPDGTFGFHGADVAWRLRAFHDSDVARRLRGEL
jgi:hypothetical protein